MKNVTERRENLPPSNLWEWLLSNASKLRDLALAGAAGTYAVGFIVWSIHASINNLGLLPVLDSQYIIAGLVPIILAGFGVAAVYFGKKRVPTNPRLLWVTSVSKIPLIIILITIVCIYVLFVLGKLLSIVGFPFLDNIVDPYVRAPYATWEYAVYPVIMLFGYISFLLNIVLLPSDRPSATSRFFDNNSLRIFLMMVPIMAFYVLYFYPLIPHSFSGVKPRCAYLDIDISKISADSRSALFSTDEDMSIIRRSDAVDVYYAGDNWILVKKAPTDSRDSNAPEKTPKLL
jgi:hypothetical protein